MLIYSHCAQPAVCRQATGTIAWNLRTEQEDVIEATTEIVPILEESVLCSFRRTMLLMLLQAFVTHAVHFLGWRGGQR